MPATRSVSRYGNDAEFLPERGQGGRLTYTLSNEGADGGKGNFVIA